MCAHVCFGMGMKGRLAAKEARSEQWHWSAQHLDFTLTDDCPLSEPWRICHLLGLWMQFLCPIPPLMPVNCWGPEHLTSSNDSWRGPHCWNPAVTWPQAKLPIPKVGMKEKLSLEASVPTTTTKGPLLESTQPCQDSAATDHRWTLPGLKVCLLWSDSGGTRHPIPDPLSEWLQGAGEEGLQAGPGLQKSF